MVGRHGVLCAAHVHQDLGSDQNTLNQLGPYEGHFTRLLSCTSGKCLVSKDGETEPKTRTTQCSDNGGVNKNRCPTSTPPTGLLRGVFLREKFANMPHVWTFSFRSH